MISVQGLEYYIKGRKLLDNVNFQVTNNQHIGLIGRNGTGKSTIFNLILGNIESDGGKIEISKNYKILEIKQELPNGQHTAMQHLLMQNKERYDLFQELESCEDASKIAEIYEKLIEMDAFAVEAKAAKILNGLGIPENVQNEKMQHLSGGLKMRVALAALLFQEPDLLLLDEPTNHLDFETIQWLQGFLKKYPKSFILISHDKNFINHCVDSIFHIKDAKITSYMGNYDTFIKTYNLKQQNSIAYNEKLGKKRDDMMAFVHRFKAKASKAKQAQSRLKMIEKMEFLDVDQAENSITLNFLKPQKVSPPIIQYEKTSLGYEDKTILHNLTGMLYPYDKIGLIGENGKGKTTFAKFLAKELKQLKGTRDESAGLKIGYYKQDCIDDIKPGTTIYDYIKDTLNSDKVNDHFIRTHMGRFGFSNFNKDQKIHELSGGEKARLIFAGLTFENPNLLILDEPTNHLDIEMRESLVMSLNQYEGAVILITHDRFLLEHVVDKLWLVKDGKIKEYEGDIEQYKKSSI